MCGASLLLKKKHWGGTSFVKQKLCCWFHSRNEERGARKEGRGTTNITMLSHQRIPRARVHKRRGQCKKKNSLSGVFRSSSTRSHATTTLLRSQQNASDRLVQD